MSLTPQTITIDLNPSFSQMQTVHCSQYDDKIRQIEVKLKDGGVDVDVSSYTIYIEGTKPDKHGFSYPLNDIGSVDGNTVTFYIQLQMAAVPGMTRMEILLKDGDDHRIGSANFMLAVERAGLQDDTNVSDSELAPYISGAAQQAAAAANSAEAAEQAKDDAIQAKDDAVQAKESAEQSAESISGLSEQIEQNTEDCRDLKSALPAALIKETVSDNPLLIADGSDGVPVTGCILTIEPVQKGSGTPSPTNVRPIRGRTEAVLHICSVNQWDEVWELGNIDGSNGINAASNTLIRSKNYIPIRPETSYYFYCGAAQFQYKARYYDINKNYIGYLPYDGVLKLTNDVFKTPTDAYYMRFVTQDSYGTTYANNISINYPSTDTEYHAYTGTRHSTDLSTVGTVYGGALNFKTGALSVNKKSVDLGSLAWVHRTDIATGLFATNSITDYEYKQSIDAICEAYNYTGTESAAVGVTTKGSGSCAFYFMNGSSTRAFYVYDTAYSDVASFKSAMNGVHLVYDITATNYNLTAQEAETLHGNNVITSNCSNIDLTYTADSKLYIDEFADALKPLSALDFAYLCEDVNLAAIFKYQLKKDHTYCVKALGGLAMNFYAMVTANSANVTLYLNLTYSSKAFFTAQDNYDYLRVVANTTDAKFEIYDITTLFGKMYYDTEIRPYGGYVNFDIDHTMVDVAAQLSNFDFSNKSTLMAQTYAAFDSLVSAYPNYVTKADAATEVGLSYPTYASGVYNTYIYKFIDTLAGAGNSGANPKKKMFIVAGTHGNEYASPVNAYVFAHRLCNDYMNDQNLFKLRMSFDVYVIPCLNGYGMIHEWRANGNKVNINRNYPVHNWVKANEDTKDSQYGNDFTGDTAGSEFETQLVMLQTQLIKPDMCIDHHNYSAQPFQFYTVINDTRLKNLVYQSLADCSYTFKHEYSEYFGSDFTIPKNTDVAAPGQLAKIIEGMTPTWWYQNGITFACIIEISNRINYNAGVYDANGIDEYGDKTFSIGEYTLRNQILRYAQYVLNNS